MIAGKRVVRGQDYIEIDNEHRGTVFMPNAVGTVTCVEQDGNDLMVTALFPATDITEKFQTDDPVTIRFYAGAPHKIHVADGRVAVASQQQGVLALPARDAAHFDVILGRNSDLGIGVIVVVAAAKLGSPFREDRLKTLSSFERWLICG